MMQPAQTQLFNHENFFDFSRRKKAEIESEINKISDNDLLLPNQEEMLSWLIDKFTIAPINLDISHIEKRSNKVKQEVHDRFYSEIYYADALQVFWKIPYEGSENLFYIQPTRCILANFQATLLDCYLTISDVATLGDLQEKPTVIEENLQLTLERIQQQIFNINSDIRGYNQQLRNIIEEIIDKRRKKANIIKTALEAMNIPMQQNPNAPSIVPLKRKLVKPSMPTATREKSYYILDEDYRHILGVIRHVGATFERARKTFCKLKEEELRDVILADLNGHYLGQATGETFRNNGKTDINIEFENRAAFVGECKIWKGEKVFENTIQQLLSYTTWRDSKNAVIIFNKQNSEFSNIQIQIEPLIKKLDGYKSLVTTKDGEWEFNIEKDGTLKLVHVFLFDIYDDKI